MKLRDYQPKSDYQQLADLLRSCNMYYPQIDNALALKRKVDQLPGSIVIAEEDNKVIGCCYFSLDSTNEFIFHLCVDEHYRHRGYGRQLLAEVESRIKRLGSKHEPILLVEVDNQNAIRFYRQLGWQPHENKRYYMMKKSL